MDVVDLDVDEEDEDFIDDDQGTDPPPKDSQTGDNHVPFGNLLEDPSKIAESTSIFSTPTPSSAVLGDDYLQQEIGVDNIREALIEKEEGKMSSPDKKRLIRVLMEVKFVWSDLIKTLALSLQMRPLNHITARFSTWCCGSHQQVGCRPEKVEETCGSSFRENSS